MDCIFCKIASREISSEIFLEDDNFLVFKDSLPKAPVHLLIIPKIHFGPVNTLKASDDRVIGGLILKAKEAAQKAGISGSGYRLVFNVGKNAGMEIDHLHLHLLGGESLLAFSL